MFSRLEIYKPGVVSVYLCLDSLKHIIGGNHNKLAGSTSNLCFLFFVQLLHLVLSRVADLNFTNIAFTLLCMLVKAIRNQHICVFLFVLCAWGFHKLL